MRLRNPMALLLSIASCLGFIVMGGTRAVANNTEYITTSGNKFVGATLGDTFIPWGMDGIGNDGYWDTSAGWASIVSGLTYQASLGLNVVRFFPQFGTIIDSYTPGTPPTFGANSANITLLEDYLDLADSLNMRVDITGLLVLTPGQTPADPAWYDGLSTANRWLAEEAYWQAVSTAVNASAPNALFCYDLENEPISPEGAGGGTEPSWYKDVWNQYITETIATTEAAAETEAQTRTNTMVSAIRNNATGYTGDTTHMITVGTYGGSFTPSYIDTNLSFLCAHEYPGGGNPITAVASAIAFVNSYYTGKPILVEETLDQGCSIGVESQFILGSAIANDGSEGAAGWISHYLDTVSDINELESTGNLNFQQAVGDDQYELMEYLYESLDFGFEYPNLAAQVATPTITPALTKTASGGSFGVGTYYVTCSYTWYSGLNQTEAEFTSSGDAPASIAITSGTKHTVTAGSVTLPTGATGLEWYMGTAATGPFHYQGSATVTSGVAAAFTMTSYNSTSGQPVPYPSAIQWNPSILAPSGSNEWTFSTSYSSGITTYNGAYTGMTTSAPEGYQVAFISSSNGKISESVYLQQNVNYTISFHAAQDQSDATSETFYVELGGTAIPGNGATGYPSGGLCTPATGAAYTEYTTGLFNTGSGASGYYTISFNGQTAGSCTALIDDVLINPQSPDLNFEDPTLNNYPDLWPNPGNAPAGIVAATGGSIPAGNYYLACSFTWNSGNSETGLSPVSAEVTTTGSTSTITGCSTATSEPITLPANATGLDWYVAKVNASTGITGPYIYQGAATVSAGAAQPLTMTSIATNWSSTGSAPTGTASTTGGYLPAGSYYISCTYTSDNGTSQTETSPVSSAITTTGSTSSITTQSVTLPSGVTGVNWYGANSSTGVQIYQGSSAVSGGVAQPITITAMATTAEAPSVAIGYEWDPTGKNWTFTSPSGNNASGISTSGTSYTGSVVVPSPEAQTAMLEGEGTISQSVYLVSGVNYTLSFAAAQMAGNASDETFTVNVGGSQVGTAFNPSGTGYTWESTSTTFSVGTTGNYTIEFEGTNTAAVTAFINNVNISPYPNL